MHEQRLREGGWQQELNNLLRGLTGGFLVGIPLIYTMEAWWIGETVSMPHALGFVAVAYIVNLGFVTVTGFRGQRPGSRHAATEALEATGLAVTVALVTLALLHQIHTELPLDVVVGRIAVEMLPISLGVSVAHLILAPRENRLGDGATENGNTEPDSPRWQAFVLDLGAAFTGALFLSLSIAPTEEVLMLATEVPPLYLALVMLFSLALTYGIVFEAEFRGRERRRQTPGPFQRPATETVLAYLAALVTCVGVLGLYGQIDVGDDWFVVYSQVVVLGLPAAIGAAAGRLAV
jgi:putative integral membrane protein (TIGR02587 family)